MQASAKSCRQLLLVNVSAGLCLQTQLPSESLVGQLVLAQTLYHPLRNITTMPGGDNQWVMVNSLSGKDVAMLIGSK